MADMNLSLDYDFLENELYKKLGHERSEVVIEALKYFKVEKILNVPQFIKEKGFEPSIGTVFLCGSGSCYYNDEKYGNIATYNGTLMVIEGVGQHLMIANEICLQSMKKV